jgi:hypothetical protein
MNKWPWNSGLQILLKIRIITIIILPKVLRIEWDTACVVLIRYLITTGTLQWEAIAIILFFMKNQRYTKNWLRIFEIIYDCLYLQFEGWSYLILEHGYILWILMQEWHYIGKPVTEVKDREKRGWGCSSTNDFYIVIFKIRYDLDFYSSKSMTQTPWCSGSQTSLSFCMPLSTDLLWT